MLLARAAENLGWPRLSGAQGRILKFMDSLPEEGCAVQEPRAALSPEQRAQVFELYEAAEITESQASKAIGVDRLTFRELFQSRDGADIREPDAPR